MTSSTAGTRTRPDRCPGVLAPWPAEDGHLVRIRVPGGRLPAARLRALREVATAYGDGHVRVTSRANLQLRGVAEAGEELVRAVEAAGLLPSRAHDRVRNVMASPQTGHAGGRADLRPVVAELDRLLCASAPLAGLPGRFLHVLDDGRGDLVDRACDLGAVALDDRTAQLRVGAGWGPVVGLDGVAPALIALAADFLDARGSEWHVAELDVPLAEAAPPDPRVPPPADPLPYGPVPGGHHVPAPDGVVEARLGDLEGELVVTPWRGVLVPEVAA